MPRVIAGLARGGEAHPAAALDRAGAGAQTAWPESQSVEMFRMSHPNKAIVLLSAGALLLTAGLALRASAQGAQPPVGAKVHFATCAFAGVEAGCVEATSGGATYNVTEAHIGPTHWIQGTGTVSSKMSFCQQGPVIVDFVPDKTQTPQACSTTAMPVRTYR